MCGSCPHCESSEEEERSIFILAVFFNPTDILFSLHIYYAKYYGGGVGVLLWKKGKKGENVGGMIEIQNIYPCFVIIRIKCCKIRMACKNATLATF